MNIAEKLDLINTLKSKIDKLSPQKAWEEAFLNKVKIEFTYNSNKIEGNTITYGQTVQLLKDLVTPKNATTGEFLDMVNHKMVLDVVFNNYHSQGITEESIKELHRELMKNIAQWSDDGLYSPGKYKEFENFTVRSTGKIHAYMQPAEVEKAMVQLVNETNTLLENADPDDVLRHPLAIASNFHQTFLNEIHPFSDGNGRIGRIFTNLILLKKGYPPVFIREVNKDEYLKRFELSDKESTVMLDFLADRLIESLQSKLDFIEMQ